MSRITHVVLVSWRGSEERGGWPNRRLDDVKFDLDGGELAGGGRRESGLGSPADCTSCK